MKVSLSANQKAPRLQSGAVPFRIKNGELEILLIHSSHKKKWGVPKGGLEPNITMEKNAAKEAFEEAGVKGKVSRKLDTVEYIKGSTGRRQILTLYLMEVTKIKMKYDEAGDRKRKWFPAVVALNKVEPMYRNAIAKTINKVRHAA